MEPCAWLSYVIFKFIKESTRNIQKLANLPGSWSSPEVRHIPQAPRSVIFFPGDQGTGLATKMLDIGSQDDQPLTKHEQQSTIGKGFGSHDAGSFLYSSLLSQFVAGYFGFCIKVCTLQLLLGGFMGQYLDVPVSRSMQCGCFWKLLSVPSDLKHEVMDWDWKSSIMILMMVVVLENHGKTNLGSGICPHTCQGLLWVLCSKFPEDNVILAWPLANGPRFWWQTSFIWVPPPRWNLGWWGITFPFMSTSCRSDPCCFWNIGGISSTGSFDLEDRMCSFPPVLMKTSSYSYELKLWHLRYPRMAG